jgi:hypothetical protein
MRTGLAREAEQAATEALGPALVWNMADDGSTTAAPGPAAMLSLGRVRLVKHTVATGGVILVERAGSHRLTPIQYDLLALLVGQALQDSDKDESVRGYVSSPELLGSLPWDTAHPDLGHLKQLIRRVRRRLAPLGVEMQACCGLGYRLRVDEDTSGASP